MSDSQFFVPLEDARAEVQRLATVVENLGAASQIVEASPVYGGGYKRWADGSWYECQEAILSDGTYAIRIRWRLPEREPEERCWRLSPWCAPEVRLAFPGELVKGEARASAGELTWAEVRDQGLSCDRHTSPRVWCGCRAGQGGLSTAEGLGVSREWEEVMDRTQKWKRPALDLAGADGVAFGPECLGGEDFLSSDPAQDVPRLGVAIGAAWIVQCHPCGDPWESPREEVPDSRCENCGEPVRLLQAPLLEPNERGVETLGRLTDEEHKTSQRGDSLCACQVCGGAIAKGDHFRAPPRSKSGALSRSRRVHAMCAKACREVVS